MKTLILGFLALGFGIAQDADPARGASQGYAFFAPSSDRLLHFGAGGERLVYKGLGAGGEIGYIFPAREFRYGAGVLSVNGSYHLNARSHWKISPFVTTGYSLLVRSGAESFVNFGGGVNYWLSDRMGVRLEVRDYMSAVCACYHVTQFRVAFAFR